MVGGEIEIIIKNTSSPISYEKIFTKHMLAHRIVFGIRL